MAERPGIWIALGLAFATGMAVGAPGRIKLQILEPLERTGVVRDFPIAVGLVFPDGELQSLPGGRIVDDRSLSVPFEAEATGWWDARRTRVKWLLLRFRVSTDRRYVFEVGGRPLQPTGRPIAEQRGGDVLVSTGPLDVRLGGAQPGLFASVRLNGKPMFRPSRGDIVLVADDDRLRETARLSDWSLELEESTPAAASVKATGLYRLADGKPLARLDVRYLFHKDESFVRVFKTVTWMRRSPTLGVREMALRHERLLGERV